MFLFSSVFLSVFHLQIWTRTPNTMSTASLIDKQSLKPGPNELRAEIVTDAYAWDNMQIIRDQIFVVSLQYRYVLNPDKLHDSLVRLVNHGGWRKLGARLRLKVRDRRGAVKA